jgi:hypothetical protein
MTAPDAPNPPDVPNVPITPKSKLVAFTRKFLFILFFIMLGLVILGAFGSMINLVMMKIERPKPTMNDDGK